MNVKNENLGQSYIKTYKKKFVEMFTKNRTKSEYLEKEGSRK